jgi:hypothetical protein
MFTLSHIHWYETVFDSGVLIVGILLGLFIGRFVMMRHLHRGFHYLAERSSDGIIDGPDLYIAFGWPARQRRHQLMQERVERERERAADSRAAS